MRLENRNAIVTGAAKGMGAAITTRLAGEGADILLVAREQAALEPVAEQVRALGRRAETRSVDVTDEAQVEGMVAAAGALFDGRVDILVNVAGVTGPIETPAWEIALEDFERVIQTNLIGTFLPIKHVLPLMIARKYGKIVNIGGTSGLRGYRYRTAYSSSKWAIRGLTRTIALDVGEHNINVNAVCPGIVHTERMEKLCHEKARTRGSTYQEVYDEYVDEMALKRVTEAEDVADLVLFMASDESRNMTGQAVTVDGGWDV